jgi:hypothetical protein
MAYSKFRCVSPLRLKNAVYGGSYSYCGCIAVLGHLKVFNNLKCKIYYRFITQHNKTKDTRLNTEKKAKKIAVVHEPIKGDFDMGTVEACICAKKAYGWSRKA